jgi:K(+)-stimulated pyrophosphate-energized sodium pump
LLAVELAVSLSEQQGTTLGHFLSAAFLLVALIFIWRSFYKMRIEREG